MKKIRLFVALFLLVLIHRTKQESLCNSKSFYIIARENSLFGEHDSQSLYCFLACMYILVLHSLKIYTIYTELVLVIYIY